MIRRFVATIATVLICQPVLALTDEERAALHHIHQELTALEDWVGRAEQATDPQQRTTFHYPQLRDDLRAIRVGIEDAANGQRREPRRLPAIQGDY